MPKIPDIRRTVRTSRPITGEDIASALIQIANKNGDTYVERLAYELDKIQYGILGIQSSTPFKNIAVGTGERLDAPIAIMESYTQIGVRSADELRPDEENSIGYDYETVQLAVERIRDSLEAILK